MWDLETIIRLNEEAAARAEWQGWQARIYPGWNADTPAAPIEAAARESGRQEPKTSQGYLYLIEPHPGRALTREEVRQRMTLIKGGKL
jgi:hypothetical protein